MVTVLHFKDGVFSNLVQTVRSRQQARIQYARDLAQSKTRTIVAEDGYAQFVNGDLEITWTREGNTYLRYAAQYGKNERDEDNEWLHLIVWRNSTYYRAQ